MRRRAAGALASALIVLTGCSCGNDDRADTARSTTTATATRSRLCRTYDEIDWTKPPITIELSVDELADRLEQRAEAIARLLDAVDASDRAIVEAAVDADERYSTRLLREWRLHGAGPGLHDRAIAAGFFGFSEYVENLAFGDPTEARASQRALTSLLASRCEDLPVLPDESLDAGTAPAGEIIAAEVGGSSLHRFSTLGVDLGQLDVPGLEGDIFGVSLSPDGQRLAVMTSAGGRRLTIVELDDLSVTTSAGPNCAEWADDTSLWVWPRTPGPATITRVGTDGAALAGAPRIPLDGCAYRSSTTGPFVVRPRVDGAPPEIQRASLDGEAPTTVLADHCSLVAPNLSPDRSTIAYAAGCSRDRETGLYLADSDGTNRRHLVAGPTTSGTWSPDGQWLAFTAYDHEAPGDPSRLRVFVISADGEKIGAVSPRGYTWAVWVPTAHQ